MRRDLFSAGVAGAALAAMGLLAADALRPDDYVVTVQALSAESAISAEADGWTYGIPLDVPWEGADGAFHSSGRPDCLPPSGREEGPVRIKAVPLGIDGPRLRQVIFVQCLD